MQFTSIFVHSTLLAALLICTAASRALAVDERIPVIVDTDIGTAIDDPFALAAVVASERYELLAVTTCTQQAEDRAWMVCRFLTSLGMKDVPVAFGRGEQPKSEIDWQIQYRRHPAVVWDRTTQPDKNPAEDVMARVLAKLGGERKATILTLGPLTNVARLLEQHPEAKTKIDRIVMMAVSLDVRLADNIAPLADRNVRIDVPAARAVFASGIPLVVAPLDSGIGAMLPEGHLARLFAAQTPLTLELQSLYELWQTSESHASVWGAVAVRLGYDKEFVPIKRVRLSVNDQGQTRVVDGEPNALVATGIQAELFVDDYVAQVAAFGKPLPFTPPKNLSKFVERGGLPKLVHAFEDYDNDIEKRWWMTGKLELDDLPEGSRRAQRATITQDYDDLQGDPQARYRAVIFNPVPGPPMGPNTRLAFRYKLSGTDTLRVQLYSLSNGYHRYLSLRDLPQGKWQEATVDMTQMRRPDGTGGPLAADERIDDIQFYIDPQAELVIDSMILYEAADDDEKRPFPKRILFTGWFDTGKQGAEWPGDYEIAHHEKPRSWKFAKSVVNKETGRPWIRLSLRGERRLAPRNDLRFDYRLQGTDQISVMLRNSRTKQEIGGTIVGLKPGAWGETGLTFDVAGGAADFTEADEIVFDVPEGAELQIDNLLLFEPIDQ